MKYGSYRPAWAEISLDAIKGNVKAFKKHIAEETKLMAVVKADGYGHGAVEVAEAAIEAGADYLAVALLDEALILRKAGIDFPLLVLGYTPAESVKEAIVENITLTVFTEEVAEKIQQIADEMKKLVRIHIKIDSGMHRIGIRDKLEVYDLIQKIKSDYVYIEGIYTHFADADNTDSAYTKKQFQNYMEVIDYLQEKHIDIPIKHCCNSAATIQYPEMHLDMVRVGVSLYGLYPEEHLKNMISLTQAMSFKTKPVFVKTVKAEEPISYGCTYTPKKDSLIATIPIGYADGFSRSLSNKGYVTVKGVNVPIVGRICMDQSMIDVSEVGNVSRDDVVTIFGDPNEGYISMGDVAKIMNTIHYETACLIGKRIPRVYIKNGQIIKEQSLLTNIINAENITTEA